MVYSALSEFVEKLEHSSDLKRISVPVSVELEMTEIADRNVKSSGPALLFEKPIDKDGNIFNIPVLINAYASDERMNMALGVESLEDVADEIADLLEIKPPEGLVEKVKMLPKLARISSFSPKNVSAAPCQQFVEIENPDLFSIPALKCWPEDVGRYITFGHI